MGLDVAARADVGDLHARVGGALDPHEARVGLHGASHLVQVAHVHVAHLVRVKGRVGVRGWG